MTDHHAQARALQEKLDSIDLANCRCDECSECMRRLGYIAAALLAVEQRVWEEAAVYLDTEAKRFDHVDDGEAHMIRAFAVWCRAQARQAQGRADGGS